MFLVCVWFLVFERLNEMLLILVFILVWIVRFWGSVVRLRLVLFCSGLCVVIGVLVEVLRRVKLLMFVFEGVVVR